MKPGRIEILTLIKHSIVSLMRFLYVLLLVYCVLSRAESGAEELSVPAWSAADMLPVDSGISMLRYGAFGLGAYPYRHAAPGADIKVYVDGVPLRSFSPFGPDLELVPPLFGYSPDSGSLDGLNFVMLDEYENKPVTCTRFLVGPQHRFNFDVLFKRKVGEKNVIYFDGSSSGIHEKEDTEKNTLRSYYVKYKHLLTAGSSVDFSIWAFRDRDGLVDLDNQSHMGERKTDGVSVSLGLMDYHIGELTGVSAHCYYQSADSRYDRYGLRKSLSDNTAGVNVTLSTKRGNSEYGLKVLHDIRFFDSRIHTQSWTRNMTDITSSVKWENSRFRLALKSGLMYSSKYGEATGIEGELVLLGPPEQEFVIRVLSTDEFPDTGKEYYTSLAFSRNAIVSELEKYNTSELEAGLRFIKKHVNLGLYGFISSSEAPLLGISTAVQDIRTLSPYSHSTECYKGHKNESSGYRIFCDAYVEKQYKCTVMTNFKYRTANLFHRSFTLKTWIYPPTEFFSHVNLSRNFFSDRLTQTFFGTARYMRWRDWESSPEGNYFFLDVGITVKVSSLELFYKIENVTNEEMKWFNTMGWLGRNALWGITWRFED